MVAGDYQAEQELVPGMQPVIMSDKRNFSYPHQSPVMSTVPLDFHSADDSPEISFNKMVQQFFANNPMGFKYTGKIDGIVNPELINVIKSFELAYLAKHGIPIQVVIGSRINQKGFQEAVRATQQTKQQPEKPQEKKPEEVSSLTKAFQTFFSQAQPIIGKVYSGPVDGQINAELIGAAKKAEDALATGIKNNKIKGMLWNDVKKNFNTSPEDLKQALSLIANKNQ